MAEVDFPARLCYIYYIRLLEEGQDVMALEFEWDSQKAAINREKHGITFEVAANVFYDENRIEIFDKAHSMEEDRYITIGLYKEVLFVVYTERCPKIRIISARLATARERKLYYGSNI